MEALKWCKMMKANNEKWNQNLNKQLETIVHELEKNPFKKITKTEYEKFVSENKLVKSKQQQEKQKKLLQQKTEAKKRENKKQKQIQNKRKHKNDTKKWKTRWS